MLDARSMWMVIVLTGCLEPLWGGCDGEGYAVRIEPQSGAGDPIDVDEAWVVHDGAPSECTPLQDSTAWTCGSEPGTYEAWLNLDPWGESADLDVVVEADACGLPVPETVVLIVSLPDDPLPGSALRAAP